MFLNKLSVLLLIIKLLYEKVIRPYWNKILSSQNCSFFTSIDNTELSHKLHDKVMPLVRRRYQDTSKKMGREKKSDSNDEFLLTFMKLRLGLLNQDLAQQFDISESLITNIFHS